jgi:hypothetical protein
MKRLQLGLRGLRVEEKFAEGADGEAANGLKGGGIVGIEN